MDLLTMTPDEALNHHYEQHERSPYDEIRLTTYPAFIRRRDLYLLQPERRKEDWVSGDVAYDKRAMEAIVPAYVTIEHMLAIFDQDGYLRLRDPIDKNRIYRILTLHLKCCRIHNFDPIRGAAVELYALDLMDRFCDSVFEGGRHEILVQGKQQTEDARTRFNREMGLMSNKRVEHDESYLNAKRQAIFSKEEMTDDFMTTGTSAAMGDDDLFEFGDNEWT